MGFGVIAINANDPGVQPEDSLDEMRRRSAERGMRYPYVVDPTSDGRGTGDRGAGDEGARLLDQVQKDVLIGLDS